MSRPSGSPNVAQLSHRIDKRGTVFEPPEGLSRGMRVVTNAVYARCYPRVAKRRFGTIIGGSKGADGECVILLDDHKYPQPLSRKLFDLVKR